MTISVVSVFNRRAVFEEVLAASCERQDEPVELVGVDNSGGRFDRASKALNWGAKQATGDWVVFAHQDVALLTSQWSQRVRECLESLQPNGWCGIVGRDVAGRWRGLLLDRHFVSGVPFSVPQEVETLDEVVLIHRRLDGGVPYFDEQLFGWHAYGVDACCEARRQGHSNYVLSAPIWHDSPSTNREGLAESHRFIEQKHCGSLGRVPTTCGYIPEQFKRRGSYRLFQLQSFVAGTVAALRTRTKPVWNTPLRKPTDVLDEWTLADQEIACIRGPAWYRHIDSVGFCDDTSTRRSVAHWFGDWQDACRDTAVVVVGPEVEVCNQIRELDCEKLIVSENIGELPRRRKEYRLPKHQFRRHQMCRDQDDGYWLLSEFGLRH